MKYIRDFSYIYNSKIDYIDLWVNLTLMVFGIHFALFNPMEVQSYYHYMVDRGFTSEKVGIICCFFGFTNIIRILLPIRATVFISLITKSLSLFVLLSLLLTVIHDNLVPPVLVFYLMVSLLYFDNIMRTK